MASSRLRRVSSDWCILSRHRCCVHLQLVAARDEQQCERGNIVLGLRIEQVTGLVEQRTGDDSRRRGESCEGISGDGGGRGSGMRHDDSGLRLHWHEGGSSSDERLETAIRLNSPFPSRMRASPRHRLRRYCPTARRRHRVGSAKRPAATTERVAPRTA